MKNTYRHWINGFGYYTFKTWKVYRAYCHLLAEDMDKKGSIGLLVSTAPGSAYTYYTNYAERYK